MYGWLVMNLYTIAIATVLLTYNAGKWNNRDYGQKCAYTRLLSIVLVLMVSNCVSMAGSYGLVGYVPSRTANFVTYFMDPFIYFFAVSYIHIWQSEDDRLPKARGGLLMIAIANALLVMMNEVMNTGWLYYYDNAGLYHRGSFFMLRSAIKFLCLLFIEVYVLINKESFELKYRKAILIFPILPIIGGTLQSFILPWAFEYTGLIFSCMVLFISVQCRDVNHDYLTNAVNRRMMDTALDDRLKWGAGKTFAGIMIDVDYFKMINDKYGHSMGDMALIELSKILHECFRKNSDVVARYGGDEFFVIADIQSKDELDKTIQRIFIKLDEFNHQKNIPYEMSISVGAAIYDPAVDVNMDSFRNRLDNLMYEEKQRHHASRDMMERAAFLA
ncbi:MAG: GGDEF domain-containing protein [Lachnospiraceae bacterium]|nr:GGDEF domain-containing protein [Lachnospiraceae bacterium]